MKSIHVALSCLTVLLFASCKSETVSPNGLIKVREDGSKISILYKSSGEWTGIAEIMADVESYGKASHCNVDYEMLTGKKIHCHNSYTQREYILKDGSIMTFRVWNDGVTWSGADSCRVNLSTSENDWLQRWRDSYEEFFPKNREEVPGYRIAYPALFEYSDGTFALLSESCMNAGSSGTSMYFTDKSGVFDLRADADGHAGWQTLIIGSLADMVESTLVTDNSEPNKLADTSWIEPGVASWIYWAYNHGSNNYDILKMYIDMAVEIKLPYILIDAEWDEMPNLPENKGKTVEDVVKYAVEKGVKPMIWYNSSIGWIDGAPTPKFRLNTPEDREREFAWCESIGIKGVKVDFFNGDGNENFKLMAELLEDAARHHLLVNFHGCTTMRGWQRTYPNLISAEAVYGAEWYNNKPVLTNMAASHNATLPFTRNVIGSMDYTPCAFTDSQHPHITTHAHELALTALFESGIQHLADRPSSFLSQPQAVKDYLAELPTVWEDTRYISGYPGVSAVLARRSGDRWYVAGINGLDEEQDLDISALSALLDIKNTATLFADGNPWSIDTVTVADLNGRVHCRARGGFVLILP